MGCFGIFFEVLFRICFVDRSSILFKDLLSVKIEIRIINWGEFVKEYCFFKGMLIYLKI